MIQPLDPGRDHLSSLLVLTTSRTDEDSVAGCDRFRTDAGRSLMCTIALRPLDDAAMAELVQMRWAVPSSRTT